MPPTLVILAAGMGSRYGGLKQMAAVGPEGQAILDYSVFDAARAGFGSVVFIIRHDFEDAFRKHVEPLRARFPNVAFRFAFQESDDLPAGITPPAQRSKPWGTGHAVWCARRELNGPFAVINADDFYGTESFDILSDFLGKSWATSTDFALAGFRLGQTLSTHGTVTRGICSADTSGLLTGIVETSGLEPDPVNHGARVRASDGTLKTFPADTLVSMNCWAFTPSLMPLLDNELSTFLRANGTDPKAECYLPGAIAALVAGKKARVSILPTPSQWFGVTYREDEPALRSALLALHASGHYPKM